MADKYVNGEIANTWGTAIGNTADQTYDVDDDTDVTDMDSLEELFDNEGAVPYEMVDGRRVYIRYAQLPESNNAVSVQAITDILGYTVGYVTGYSGSGMWVPVSRALVLNSIMRAMYSIIEAGQVSSSLQTLLNNRLDEFCIEDTDNIPVYVDSSGNSHIFQEAIEAIRDELINQGAFAAGAGTVTNEAQYAFPSEFSFPLAVSGNDISLTGATVPPTTKTYQVVSGSPNVVMFLGSSNSSSEKIISIHFASSNPFAISVNGVATNATLASYDDRDYYYIRTSIVVSASRYTVTGGVLNDIQPIGNIPSAVNAPLDYCIAYGASSAGIAGMIPSASIPVGFGDLSLPLDDVVPGWVAKKKQVATPKRVAGADDDIWAKTPVLPLDVPTDSVWEDGYAGDSEDTYEGDLADIIKQAIVDAIPDIIAKIIENTGVTEDDVMDIPVDDGGDTPPAQPPVLNGSSNGLWTMYNPTKAQVNAFGAWLWADTLIDHIMRQFNSPIDAVIGFHQIYCTPITGADKVIKAGYLDSPVSAKEITDQYATIDCGSISVDEFYNTALDYTHTRMSIYLPFVGIVQLDNAVVMGSILQVIYRIDVFTGTCLAQIKVIKQNSNAVMYAFEGNCAVQIPLTATTYCGVAGALINLGQSGISLMMGNMGGAIYNAFASVGSGISDLTGVKQSGAMGSNAGALGIRKPYIIVTRPIAYDAVDYNSQYGFPINKTVTLGSLSGYTKVKDIHLAGIPCTDDELELIESLLKDGVIIN